MLMPCELSPPVSSHAPPLLPRPYKGDLLLFYSLTPDGQTDMTSLHASCPTLKGVRGGFGKKGVCAGTRWQGWRNRQDQPARQLPSVKGGGCDGCLGAGFSEKDGRTTIVVLRVQQHFVLPLASSPSQHILFAPLS